MSGYPRLRMPYDVAIYIFPAPIIRQKYFTRLLWLAPFLVPLKTIVAYVDRQSFSTVRIVNKTRVQY